MYRWLLSLFFVVLSTTHAQDCGQIVGGCGPFGDCHSSNKCFCHDGYGGDDCSMPVTFCEDGRKCFNGGTCATLNTYDPVTGKEIGNQVHCDCSTAVGEASLYAGHQCEFPAERSCERGKPEGSFYAFCTNSGNCKGIVNPGEPHPGCFCHKDYEGRHCQYRRGTAPANEPIYSLSVQGSTGGISGFGVFCLILLVLGFVGGVGYVLFYRPHSSSMAKEPAEGEFTGAPADLQLDDEGLDNDDEEGMKDVEIQESSESSDPQIT